MNRRQFLEKSVVGGAALTLGNSLDCNIKEKASMKHIEKKQLGKTGEKLSVIGFGGIVVKDEEQTNANNLVAIAFDRGINYFDVAPTYGNAEEKLGPALQPYRQQSFLACKTTKRSKADAEKELHESLRKLHTDHFDLYQLHAITTKEDVETAFGPNGAMEVFVKARQDGKVKYLGFSAHSEEAALMAMEKFDFDTVLFPINFVCWHQGNFGPRVVAEAQKQNMGILALKTFAFTRIGKGEERPYEKCWYRPIPLEDNDLADMSFRFTMSHAVTAAIPPGEPDLFWRALDIAIQYKPIGDKEKEKLLAVSQGVEPIFKTA